MDNGLGCNKIDRFTRIPTSAGGRLASYLSSFYYATMAYFQQRTVRLLLDWPAQSPDLNVIDHMWSILKKELDELYNAAKDIWELIPN